MGMGLFTRTKKVSGWMAISFQEDGIYAAFVKRMPAAAPEVGWVTSYPTRGAEVSEPLEKLCKEQHAGRYHCTTLLSSGEYQILSVDAPDVPPGELKAAIRWHLKDMLDFPVDDATIDVLDIPADKNAPVRNRSIYALAARNQLIEQRQALFGQAKIPLSVIDVPEMAQRNISSLLEPEGRGVALLSFAADGGLMTVTYSGELYLSRRIDVKLPQLLQSDDDQKKACYDRITLELQRSFDHFDRQYHFITISKLVLAPLGAADSGLQEYLATNLYVPTEALNLETVLDISMTPELMPLDAQQRYFLTLGAALRHEEKAP